VTATEGKIVALADAVRGLADLVQQAVGRENLVETLKAKHPELAALLEAESAEAWFWRCFRGML